VELRSHGAPHVGEVGFPFQRRRKVAPPAATNHSRPRLSASCGSSGRSTGTAGSSKGSTPTSAPRRRPTARRGPGGTGNSPVPGLVSIRLARGPAGTLLVEGIGDGVQAHRELRRRRRRPAPRGGGRGGTQRTGRTSSGAARPAALPRRRPGPPATGRSAPCSTYLSGASARPGRGPWHVSVPRWRSASTPDPGPGRSRASRARRDPLAGQSSPPPGERRWRARQPRPARRAHVHAEPAPTVVRKSVWRVLRHFPGRRPWRSGWRVGTVDRGHGIPDL
jgi:hypothetical protein